MYRMLLSGVTVTKVRLLRLLESFGIPYQITRIGIIEVVRENGRFHSIIAIPIESLIHIP
jgi:hypothetical protein